MTKPRDIKPGMTMGEWTVLAEIEPSPLSKRRQYKVRCSCGTEDIRQSQGLTRRSSNCRGKAHRKPQPLGDGLYVTSPGGKTCHVNGEIGETVALNFGHGQASYHVTTK